MKQENSPSWIWVRGQADRGLSRSWLEQPYHRLSGPSHWEFWQSACRTVSKAKQLCGDLKNATPKALDVTSEKDLDEAVSQHDLIISLIPYTFHIPVIKSAIKFKRNVITTSYVSDEIKALEPEYLPHPING